jgi:hypothetical protein
MGSNLLCTTVILNYASLSWNIVDYYTSFREETKARGPGIVHAVESTTSFFLGHGGTQEFI